jgi:glycosyltransferase involved in cell wall biosynthesis
MRKVLMLAYVFPPFFSVGGSIRVVKFIKYLPSLGWLPVVLSIDDSKEYDTQRKEGSETLLQEVPDAVKIYRTGAGEPTVETLEKGREARRKYWLAAVIVNLLKILRQWLYRYLLLPDRHITWLPFAVMSGRKIIKEEGIDIIFATGPPHSTVIIAAILKWLTRKRLVLDFRDDWIDTPWHCSKPKMIQRIERWLEKWAVKTADKVILVTEWSKKAFINRYSEQSTQKFVLIPNGFDLQDFQKIEPVEQDSNDSKFIILHAGLLSEGDGWNRNPKALFQALVNIRTNHHQVAENLAVNFTGYLPQSYRDVVETMGLGEIVKELGDLPHQECIRFMMNSDLLLAINYDDWPTIIPAKIYEYWAVGGAPILLLSCSGAAENFVKDNNLGISVQPYDVDAIQQSLLNVYKNWREREPVRINSEGVENFDRKTLAKKLAQVLSTV